MRENEYLKQMLSEEKKAYNQEIMDFRSKSAKNETGDKDSEHMQKDNKVLKYSEIQHEKFIEMAEGCKNEIEWLQNKIHILSRN